MNCYPLIPAVLLVLSVSIASLDVLADPSVNAELTSREAFVLERICADCHAHAEIGVPVMGDEAEWERRREKGFSILLANTINGMGNMPPLGTCSFCSEEELSRLVAFVAGFSLTIDADPTRDGDETLAPGNPMDETR